MVKSKGWDKPVHYWRAKSECCDLYAISTIPQIMLVDTKGKVVFKGHPAKRKDLAGDLTTLLSGKEIVGSKSNQEKWEERFKQCSDQDLLAINQEMNEFKETGKLL